MERPKPFSRMVLVMRRWEVRVLQKRAVAALLGSSRWVRRRRMVGSLGPVALKTVGGRDR